MPIQSYGLSDEDGLYIVADGMGGHAAGEVASEIAVQAVSEFVVRTRSDLESTWPFSFDETLSYEENRLKTSIRLANKRIREAVEQHSDWQGMGSTLVALLLGGEHACVGHVGDSRLYRWRPAGLQLLTRDHTWVGEQLAGGALTAEEARNHPYRNVVTRALGTTRTVEVDLLREPLQGGDCFLLCSDGLTAVLEDRDIEQVLAGTGDGLDPERTCRLLVEETNRRGGPDNVSVILVRYRG
jgi:serine/threonine protein phosphatase PrpC